MFQGQAVSGLVCNIVMMIALLSADKADNTKIYTAYLIIGDIGMVIFLYLLFSFFANWKDNQYSIPMIDNSVRKSVIRSDIDEAFELTSKSEEKVVTEQKALMDYRQLMLLKTDIYLGMLLNFISTLGCFPVLTFRINIGAPDHIKFALITLIFNIGDIGSRYIYSYWKFESLKSVHILNIIKVSFFPLHFLMINSTFGLLDLVIVKILLIFVFAFLNGYLCMAYFEWASVGLESQFDRNKSGKLLSISLQLGLMIGSFISMAW
jgi:hypothetical protein